MFLLHETIVIGKNLRLLWAKLLVEVVHRTIVTGGSPLRVEQHVKMMIANSSYVAELEADLLLQSYNDLHSHD
jgi:hypothetical protein